MWSLEKIGLSTHVMEKYVCEMNSKYGVGDKEESFTEQWHQDGIKDDGRYHEFRNFEKKAASKRMVRAITSHPLVKETQLEILSQSQWKWPASEKEK